MKQPKMNYKISSKGSRKSQGLKRESFNHLINHAKYEVNKDDFNLNAQAGLFNRSALEQNQEKSKEDLRKRKQELIDLSIKRSSDLNQTIRHNLTAKEIEEFKLINSKLRNE